MIHLRQALQVYCRLIEGAGVTSESILPQREAEGPRRWQLQHSHHFVGWCEMAKAGALLLEECPFRVESIYGMHEIDCCE